MARPEPIPCLMEMNSADPFFIFPEALRARGAQIAAGLFQSFTMGVRQFCTKPGLVFLPQNEDADAIVIELTAQVEKASSSPVLTEGICRNYNSAIAQRQTDGAVKLLVQAPLPPSLVGIHAAPARSEEPQNANRK